MQIWLLFAAVLPVAAVPNGTVPMTGLLPVETAHVATARALDFRLQQESGSTSPTPLLRGIVVRHNITSNTSVGFGMTNLYSRRKASFDLRDDGRPKRSKKPAVNFTLKF